jgi:hypothetical protein
MVVMNSGSPSGKLMTKRGNTDISGKLAALRWVLGSEWDFLDL